MFLFNDAPVYENDAIALKVTLGPDQRLGLHYAIYVYFRFGFHFWIMATQEVQPKVLIKFERIQEYFPRK